jgi:predicted enzyme related to lactoylglutathione lyase
VTKEYSSTPCNHLANATGRRLSPFAVENADETVARVKEHGGKVLGNIDDSPFGRIAALMDPSGAFFKIVEPPKG